MPATQVSAGATGAPDDHKVRERAYHLWEKAGCPHGQHHDHWEQASREIAAEANGGKKSDAVQAAPATEQAKPASGKTKAIKSA